MVRINWLKEALIDLQTIYEYIAIDSKKYAKLQVYKLKEHITILKKHPEIGKVVQEINNPSIKELVYGNYRIIYQIKSKEEILILMIHHGARNIFRRIQK